MQKETPQCYFTCTKFLVLYEVIFIFLCSFSLLLWSTFLLTTLYHICPRRKSPNMCRRLALDHHGRNKTKGWHIKGYNREPSNIYGSSRPKTDCPVFFPGFYSHPTVMASHGSFVNPLSSKRRLQRRELRNQGKAHGITQPMRSSRLLFVVTQVLPV